MRLDFALAATRHAGFETSLLCWMDGRWTEVAPDAVTQRDPRGKLGVASGSGRVSALKRWAFPSTLWESARDARASTPELQPTTNIVLHTSYLAPLTPSLKRRGHYVAVDAYDLIWRVHEVDAKLATGFRRLIRSSYAASVRPRELSGLRVADSLLAAGWTDTHDLASAAGRAVTWAPTGLRTEMVNKVPSDRLRVGLLGNFRHSATIAAAEELMASPLAQTDSVELVFAGLHSDEWDGRCGARGMGTVKTVDEFYRAVDATVVPVTNPSGMKTKLAESALAGRPVVTTTEGAVGYPPHLQNHFTVLELAALTAEKVRSAVAGASVETARAAFVNELGWDNALSTYRSGFGIGLADN